MSSKFRELFYTSNFIDKESLSKLLFVVKNITNLEDYHKTIINSYGEFLNSFSNSIAIIIKNLTINSIDDLVYSFDNILYVIKKSNISINLIEMDFLKSFQNIQMFLGINFETGIGRRYSLRVYELYLIRFNPFLYNNNITFNITAGNNFNSTNISNDTDLSNKNIIKYNNYPDIFIPIKLFVPPYLNSTDIILAIQFYGLKIYLGKTSLTLPLNYSTNISIYKLDNKYPSVVKIFNKYTAINVSLRYYNLMNMSEINTSACSIYQSDFNLSACKTYVGYSTKRFRCDCDTYGQIFVIKNATLDLNLTPIIPFPTFSEPFFSSYGYGCFLTLFIIVIMSLIAGYWTDKVMLRDLYINLKEKKEYFHYRDKLKKGMFDLKEITVKQLFWEFLKYTHEIISIYCFSDLYFLRIHRILVLFVKIYMLIFMDIFENEYKFQNNLINKLPRQIPNEISSQPFIQQMYISGVNVN